jgi:hypothetical protein
MRGVWLAVLSAALLSGCASVVEGRTQDITVNTTPSGATCLLNREGAPIATIASTPGTVKIEKNEFDIEVVCERDGYEKTAYLNESATAAAVFGNVLIGGAIGVAVDISNGSSNKYDDTVDITLSPRAEPPQSTTPQPVVAATGLPAPAPTTLAPATLAPPAMPPTANAAYHPFSAGPALPPVAGIVDTRRAENAAERYRVLRRLVTDGLVPADRYNDWARQNAGAFLLTTVAPPFAGAGNKPPSYDKAADFLGNAVKAEKNAKVAEAERQAFFHALMPMEGARLQAVKPPADTTALQNWYLFLDQLRDEGILAAESVEAEKNAINDARIAAGLSPVPVYSAASGVAVQ